MNIFKRNFDKVWIFLPITICVIFLIPVLGARFWWVDDGEIIMTAQKAVSAISSLHFQGLNIILMEQGGRLRVIYWIYLMLVSTLGGANTTIYFIVHFLMILGASIYIYKILMHVSKSQFAGIAGAVLYLVTPINAENIYRLGPVEPILSFLIAAGLYYLLKKRMVWSILLLFLAVFTKEAGFVLWLPMAAIYLHRRIFDKIRDISLEKYSLWGLTFSIPVFLNALFRKTGYSSNYVFNIDQIASNLTGYIGMITESFSPLFVLFVATFIMQSVIYHKKKVSEKRKLYLLYQTAFLFLFVIFVAVISPWKYYLGRYLMPATVGLVIFIGLEIASIRTFLFEHKASAARPIAALFISYLVFFTVGNIFRTYINEIRFARETVFIQSIFNKLAKEVPQNGLVLVNFPDIETNREYVIETDMQLDYFYNRPDIRVGYLNLEKPPKENFIVIGTSIVKEKYDRRVVEMAFPKFQKDEYNFSEKIYPVLTNPANIITQIIKKTYGLVIKGTPFSGDGIVANYISKEYWYKYMVTR